MAVMPHLRAQVIPGVGMMVVVDLPPEEIGKAILISEESMNNLVIEMTGKNPIPGWIKLPGFAIAEEKDHAR
jgi:hypothetical protein